ncbi:TetR/AcrR family transcriptional regulator [Paraburkholderia panacisoli]|uniref:TetR/AcrR family transcriptional regulator n=1 Tax=Paraburkholderia panacisoli TaxID=2603818 RepID=A0A5B0GN04_9BURK|nr:TetR/AcrR family transcriptional regulator [Paraburkholderia panacisoli]KAA1004884.1 TetR/AcrR family transcriptional regulator [Paraburkholderia panacisoli]
MSDTELSRRAEAKRAAILDAAVTLFLESGFDAVTLDHVVARAGGSKATVYSYFGAKDNLFHSCVEHLCEKILQSVSLFDVDDLPIEEALRQIGVSFLNAVLSEEALALHRLVVAEGKRFPEIANRFYSAGPGRVYSDVARILRQHEGVASKAVELSELSVLFVDMLTAEFQLQMLLGIRDRPSKKEIARRVDHAVRVMMTGACLRRS